jgi:formylmethanofuran dehydrogenase subunit E
MPDLKSLLDASAARHAHLCPRQVLGVRIGIRAGRELGLILPQSDKRLFAFVETDGCAADGIAVATGCQFGRRTLRLMDFGKVAATFVDTKTGRAIRIYPRADARQAAAVYAPETCDDWHAQLIGYQRMPDVALLHVQPVRLRLSLDRLISRPGLRAICQACGEEIMNERQVQLEGQTLCRACAGQAYYTAEPVAEPQPAAVPDLPAVGETAG